jgi:Polyphosphate kinase C-terminal domain 2
VETMSERNDAATPEVERSHVKLVDGDPPMLRLEINLYSWERGVRPSRASRCRRRPTCRSTWRRWSATAMSGLSDGIRVVAPLGRHFETSRLFGFGTGKTTSWYLSSGDLALAHLDRQIDVAVPVDDPAHRARLEAMVDALLRLPAWEMDAGGSWHRGGPGAEGALRELAASAGTLGGTGVSLR